MVLVLDGRELSFLDGFLDNTIEGLTKRLPKYYQMVRIGEVLSL